MPSPETTPPENRLIAALSRRERAHLLEQCQSVDLKAAEILGEPRSAIRHVYFPSDSIISLVNPIAGHAGLEVGLVGNEGMLGTPLLLGVNLWPFRVVVQGAGAAWRIRTALFQRELKHSAALHHRLDRYIYVSMRQLAQSAACTRFHVVEERLARWLLMTQDRAGANTFHVTQEFLASMLGVRRVGVTAAAGLLQRRNLIVYRRGRITVLDREGLQAAACRCYQADQGVYKCILG